MHLAKDLDHVLFHFTCVKVLFRSTLRLYFHFSVKLNSSLLCFFRKLYNNGFIPLNMCCTYGIPEKKNHADNRY